MASPEDRDRHSKRRKIRNQHAKVLRESGAFKMKVIDPRKGKYKRENLSPKDIYGDTEEQE